LCPSGNRQRHKGLAPVLAGRWTSSVTDLRNPPSACVMDQPPIRLNRARDFRSPGFTELIRCQPLRPT